MDTITLRATLEIQDLIVRYATGIDRRDWVLFRSCFTEECDADYGPFGHWQSASEITDWMISAHEAYGNTLHRITNIAAYIEGASATCRSYVDVILQLRDGVHFHHGYGIYDDELVHSSEGWMIARRRYTVVKSGRNIER